MLTFVEADENRRIQRKNPRIKDENQQQTQPIYGVDSRSIITGPDNTKAALKNVCVGLDTRGSAIASD